MVYKEGPCLFVTQGEKSIALDTIGKVTLAYSPNATLKYNICFELKGNRLMSPNGELVNPERVYFNYMEKEARDLAFQEFVQTFTFEL